MYTEDTRNMCALNLCFQARSTGDFSCVCFLRTSAVSLETLSCASPQAVLVSGMGLNTTQGP